MKTYPRSLALIAVICCHKPQSTVPEIGQTEPIIQELLAGNKPIDADSLEHFKETEISFLVNVIYAKHGHIFEKREYAERFFSFPWYKPRHRNVEKYLDEMDLANIETLVWHRNSIHFQNFINEKPLDLPPDLNDAERGLIGIWQPSPAMASGWAETYSFFLNRTVAYRPNSMDCEERLIFRVGHWRLEKNILRISWFAEAKTVGGRLEEASGSCASEKDLVGDRPQSYRLKKKVLETLKISRIRQDREFQKNLMEINGSRFWQGTDDPHDY